MVVLLGIIADYAGVYVSHGKIVAGPSAELLGDSGRDASDTA